MPFIEDGYQTLVTFSALPAALFLEKEVEPPSVDGGGSIDTTTMRNATVRTSNPKSLITFGDMMLQANFDPAILTQLLTTLIQNNNLITVKFPDASSWAFWGFLDIFKVARLKEGDFPLADLTVHCSNHDNSGNEVIPVYAAGP